MAVACTLGATGKPGFDSARRYHIVCRQHQEGCVADGAWAGQTTPLYYLPTATTDDATYWLFTEEQQGLYSIRNARTGQYVTYDGVRTDQRRYVSMTDQMDGSYSLWTMYMPFNEEGIYAIRNAGQTDQVWDAREGSGIVGTYTRPNTQDISWIESFLFYDEQGTLVTERASNDTGQGFDVSSWIDATTDSADGWTFDAAPWTDPGFGDYHNGEASVVSPFLERWNDTNQGPLPNDGMHQQIMYLPAGDYTLQADIIAVRQPSNNGWWGGQQEETGHGVFLTANDARTEAGTQNELPQRYSVDVTIDAGGTMTIGLSIAGSNANWVACDNFRLIYKGTEQQMLDGEKNKVRQELADYFTPAEIEAMMLQAGNDFYALEQLRKSTETLATIDPLSRYYRNFTIDGRAPVYVASLGMYLCPLPLQNFGSTYAATIDYTPREGQDNIIIGTHKTAPGAQYSFAGVKGGKTYTLRAKKSDGNMEEMLLTFTSLPVVKMYGSFSNSYSQGSIIVHEPDKGAPQMLSMKAKWRGGITNLNGKHKRNYHVKLLDENGDKLEQKFFGLRNDNSWILESCQVDMSRIRNRVLTDLWNDFSTPPYYISQEPKAMTGSRGRFVELILNDEYRGIYCMTENMDRKQMKLAKYDETTGTVHGQLWKSKDWTYATMMGWKPDGGYYPKDFLTTPDVYNEMWDQYQVKYPDLEDVSPTDWKMLYDAVNMVATSSDDNFKRYVKDYFDLPLVMDYYILMETILATDNHGKNMFFAIYDKARSRKITFGVWDMDATSGQRWSDDYYHWSGMQPEQDYSQYIRNYEHGDFNLFERLRRTNADDFNQKVRLRYRDLRQTYLNTESILQRFRTQLDEFKTCGAAQREYDRWNGDTDISRRSLDFDTEMDYLTDWFTRRMQYLDDVRFDIGSLPSSIAEQQQTNRTYDVYDLQGQKVGTHSNIGSLPAGVYVINGRKIVKK